jgi:hypothetical protein
MNRPLSQVRVKAVVLAALVVGGATVATPGLAQQAEHGASLSTVALPPGPLLDDLGDPGDALICPAPKPGTLTLNTVPWTMVYVDDVLVGTTPLFRHELAAGPHRLSLVNDARDVFAEEDVVIDEGRAHKLKLLLVAESSETLLAKDDAGVDLDCVDDADAGYVTVQTSPWSKVWINGKLVGITPVFQTRVRAGEHALRFKGRDGQLFATRVMVAAGEVVKVALELPRALPAAPVSDGEDVLLR